jgi:hypothetical protein
VFASLPHGHALTLHCVLTAGVEVGQYAGFVRSLRALQQSQPDSIPSRIERNLAAMEECLLQFPLYDPLVSPAAVLGWCVRRPGGGGGSNGCSNGRVLNTVFAL